MQLIVFMVWVLMFAASSFLFGLGSPSSMLALGCAAGQIVGVVIYRIEFGYE